MDYHPYYPYIVISSTSDGKSQIWNTKNKKVLKIISVNVNELNFSKFNPKGNKLIIGGDK